MTDSMGWHMDRDRERWLDKSGWLVREHTHRHTTSVSGSQSKGNMRKHIQLKGKMARLEFLL